MTGTLAKTKVPANKKALEVSLLAAVKNNQIQNVKDCIEQLSVLDPDKSFLNLIDNESKKTLLQISYPLATNEIFAFLLNQGADPDQGDIAHKIDLVVSVIRDGTHAQFPQVLAAITEMNYESYRIDNRVIAHPHITLNTILQASVCYSLDAVVQLLKINSVSPLETTSNAIYSPFEISIVLHKGEIFNVFLATEKVKSELFNDESSLLTKIGKIGNVDIIKQVLSIYPELKQIKYYEKILKEANIEVCKAFLPELIVLLNNPSSDVDWVRYLEEVDTNDTLFNEIVNSIDFPIEALLKAGQSEKISRKHKERLIEKLVQSLKTVPANTLDVDWVRYLEEVDTNDILFKEILNSIDFSLRTLINIGKSEKISRNHKELLLEKLAQTLTTVPDNTATLELLLECLTISPLRRSIVESVIKKMPIGELSKVTAEESKHIFWLLLNDDDYEYRFISNNILRNGLSYLNNYDRGPDYNKGRIRARENNEKISTALDAYKQRYGRFLKKNSVDFDFENVAIAEILTTAGLIFQLEGKPPQNISFPNQAKSFARHDYTMIDNVLLNSNIDLITWTLKNYPCLLVEASDDALLIKTCYKNQFSLDTSDKKVQLINKERIFPIVLERDGRVRSKYDNEWVAPNFLGKSRDTYPHSRISHSFNWDELKQLEADYSKYRYISPIFKFDEKACKALSDFDFDFTVVRQFSVGYYPKLIVPAIERRRVYLNLMSAFSALEDALIPTQWLPSSRWKQYDVIQVINSAKFKDFCIFIKAVAGYESLPNLYSALSEAVDNDTDVNTDIPQAKLYSSIKKDILRAFKKIDECQIVWKSFKQYCEKLSLVEDTQPKNSNSMTRAEVIKQLRIRIADECNLIEGKIIVVPNTWDADDKKVVERLANTASY